MTHCVLGKHERAHSFHEVLGLHRQVHQLNSANTFGLEDNTLGVGKVSSVSGSTTKHVVVDFWCVEQSIAGFINTRWQVSRLQDANTSNLDQLTAGQRTVAFWVEVAVDGILVLSQQLVVVIWSENTESTVTGHVLAIHQVSGFEDAFVKLATHSCISTRVATVLTFRVLEVAVRGSTINVDNTTEVLACCQSGCSVSG